MPKSGIDKLTNALLLKWLINILQLLILSFNREIQLNWTAKWEFSFYPFINPELSKCMYIALHLLSQKSDLQEKFQTENLVRIKLATHWGGWKTYTELMKQLWQIIMYPYKLKVKIQKERWFCAYILDITGHHPLFCTRESIKVPILSSDEDC